jgi:hypothetical protein
MSYQVRSSLAGYFTVTFDVYALTSDVLRITLESADSPANSLYVRVHVFHAQRPASRTATFSCTMPGHGGSAELFVGDDAWIVRRLERREAVNFAVAMQAYGP